jgi:hypothetical protein
MKCGICLLITMAWAICGYGAIAGLAQEQASIVGLSLAKKDPASDFGQSLIPGSPVGTQIYLRILLPERTILKVNAEATKFKVVDSADKPLALNEDSNISFFATISDDRHAVIVPVQSADLPPSDATSLTITGDVTCDCGANPTTETGNVKLVSDGEVKLGPVTAKIAQVAEGFEPESQRLDFESKTSFDQIQTLVFIDDRGKEIETSAAGGGSFGFSGDMTYSKSFQFKGKAESIAKAKVTYFQKIVAVKVPVKAKFGLGLAK